MAKTCCICGEPIVGMQRVLLQMKHPVCFDCIRAAGHTPGNWMGALSTSPEELRTEINKRKGVQSNSKTQGHPVKSPERISVTRSVGNVFMVDERQRYWYALNSKGLAGNLKSNAYSLDDILEYELLEDGESIIKGGVGRAVTGGFLFGGIGAVVGASIGKKKVSGKCSSLRIKITMNNMDHPVEYIDLIRNNSVSKKSGYYKKRYEYAQEILSILKVMTSQNSMPELNAQTASASQVSAADEIRKYKELLDDGIITKEEFEAKKRQLLNL